VDTHLVNERSAAHSRTRRLGLVIVAGLVVASAVGGYAYGAIPNSGTGVISACYVTSGASKGQLRVIDAQAGASCNATETALSWNSTGINDRGTWSSSTAYRKGDAVLYRGSTYLAKKSNTNVKPTNTTTWQLLAARGAAAPTGDKGAGWNSQGVVIGIGANDIPGAPSFVASANESCLVTTTVEPNFHDGTPPPSGQSMGTVTGAISVNGAPYVHDDTGPVYPSGGGALGFQPAITVTSVFAVTAGDTIRFGAQYYPQYSNTQGIDVRQGYICS
jgi:hypothetical protein